LERAARACALRSRDLLVMLSCFSWLIVDLPFHIICPLSTLQHPRGEHILVGEVGLHTVWVDHLKNSPLGDFSETNERVDVFVHVGECKWLHFIPSMLRARVLHIVLLGG